ncbi:hypothetical protein QBC34DRAFT_348688 [Podospora aff. communis PSN243]|uniref:Uncharacterized protein n=1 Tax=Podospora aff. communis PSN243 TaxID=3040156 RepID=A0AAV9GWW3_9PEZI|nr:hypothetical protein QBC34DRAFT_348688 [Podospora aff. communis PSN243]
MRQLLYSMSVAALAGLFSIPQPAAAQPGCQTQTVHNPIGADYPMNITGVANGTLFLIPLHRDTASSLLPQGFTFVDDAYVRRNGWRVAGAIPLLGRAVYVNDIRSPDDMWRRPYTLISFELPFVDALHDGKTPFRYVHTQLIQTGNPNYAIDVAAQYGVPQIIPSVFDPECDAYDYQQRMGPSRGQEALSAIPADGSGRAVDVVAPRQVTREARPFATHVLKQMAMQPRFGMGSEGMVCGRTMALYGERVGFEAVVETKGSLSFVGEFPGLAATLKEAGMRGEAVYGIRGGSAFVDADFVSCRTLQYDV